MSSAGVLKETVCCTILRSDKTSGFKPITMLAKYKITAISKQSSRAKDLMQSVENPSSLQKMIKAPINIQNAVKKPSDIQKVTKAPVNLQKAVTKPTHIQKITPASVQLQKMTLDPVQLQTTVKHPFHSSKNDSQISSVISSSGLPFQKPVKKPSHIHKSTKSNAEISSILSRSGLPNLQPSRSFSSIPGLLKEPDGCHTILDEPSQEQRIKRITKGLQVRAILIFLYFYNSSFYL